MKTQSKKIKKPWPTKKAMEQIYEQNLWGSNNTQFYSGFGSHDPAIVKPYVEVVKKFLTSFDKSITVLDVGCGDFNVGNQFLEFTKKYIAVDIVEDLIHHNKEKFKADHLEFLCLDIAKDALPKADCVLIRQVLQHLSNAEVQHILDKVVDFQYIILTEHLPKGKFIPNKDIISGQGIRLKKQSGLDILKPPFNFKVKEKKDMFTFDLGEPKGLIKTTFYKIF
jgi:SAM-dependent methyltransferase